MPWGGSVTKKLERLDALADALRRPTAIQVGIFSDKTGRKDSGSIDNAGLGAAHEYGAPEHGLPARSWLRMPIDHERVVIMREATADALKLISEGNIRQVWVNVGIAAERAIQRAFDSGGFGLWAPLKYETLMGKLRGTLLKRKQKAAEQMFEGAQHAAILVDTGAFRRASGSRVKVSL